MAYKEPENSAQYNEILAGSTTAIVYLTATWCGPCRAIAPVFARLAGENPSITFIKVDVDKCSDLVICSSVQGVPTFVAFKGQTEVQRKTGASPANIQSLIDLLK